MKQGCSSLKTTVPDAFYKLSRISFKTIAGLLQFSVGLGHEFRFVDDETLVVALADESCRVIAFHMEDQTSAVDVHQLCLAGDGHADRRSGQMLDIHQSTDGALPFFQMASGMSALAAKALAAFSSGLSWS